LGLHRERTDHVRLRNGPTGQQPPNAHVRIRRGVNGSQIESDRDAEPERGVLCRSGVPSKHTNEQYDSNESSQTVRSR
jgi:hypothetical protein